MLKTGWVCLAGMLAGLAAPACASVKIGSVTASVQAPQVIGTAVTFSVTASDSNPGPLAFQYNVAVPQQQAALARDFNPGILSTGIWSSSFTWVPTGVEGTFHIQVVIKDFN